MKIKNEKRRKKICRPLAGPDPPLPPAIFSENRRISFFSALHFTVNIHFVHFFISLPFHIFPFDPISKEQLNMKKRLNPESLFTEQQKSTAWTLVFPGWRPAWSTWVATTLLHPVQVATVAQRRPGSNWRRCLHLTRTLCQVSVGHRRKYDYVGRHNNEDFSLNNEKLSKINAEHRTRLISHM